MDKVNMSVAILPMAEQMGWDSADEGVIQSSIFWGYAATQIIGGFLATRYGGKRVLLFAVTLWSCATMLAPLAANVSTQVFIASRVLVGIGEGLAPAAGLRMVATWVPESERSRAVSTLGSGKTTGSIAGLLLAPVVIGGFGWQAMFYSFGFLGLLWAWIWLVKGKDREGSATVENDEPIPWLSILSTPQLWGVVVAHFCHDWGGYALLTWTPTYLNQALGYNLEGSSEITVIPSVCAVAVAAGSGILADNLHGNGMDLTSVRKLFQSVGFFIPCLMLGLLATTGNVEPGSLMPIVLLTFGIASGACSYAGLYSSHADLSAKYSALVNAISTTFGALAGVCSNAYAGYMLKATGSWSQAIFLPSIALYVVGWAVYTLLYDATPVDWDAQDEK
ncbi:PHT4 [Symbiodinium natans]|uniref:PHT4 protein n=1 Tax=Symbiodinium natans TaxID=878477 RepID=A0A812JQ34_9DINO|nr:PHT4 [Symbiodinium natans]